MKDNRERVIFRRGHDPFINADTYICIFPDDPANPGMVCSVDIWKNGDRWMHDCYGEVDSYYIQRNKIIHKGDPIVTELVEGLKELYGGEYKVVEKMGRR